MRKVDMVLEGGRSVTSTRHNKGAATTNTFAFDASPHLRQVADAMLAACNGPILDVACGTGRHALYLAERGHDVVAVDFNLKRLRSLSANEETRRAAHESVAKVHLVCFDFESGTWPFKSAVFGASIMIDLYLADILPTIAHSMKPGALIFIETPKGYGGNYHSLPLRGHVSIALAQHFELLKYSERHAGPEHSQTVSVIALARRVG